MIGILVSLIVCSPMILFIGAVIADEIGFRLYWRKEMRRVLSDPYAMMCPLSTTTKE